MNSLNVVLVRKIETPLDISGRGIEYKKLGAYKADRRARGTKVRVGRHHWFSEPLLLLGPVSQGTAAVPQSAETLGFCC